MKPRLTLGIFLTAGLSIAVVLAIFVSTHASSRPDGLDKVAIDNGFVENESSHALDDGPTAGYAVDGIDELLLRFANRPGRPLPAVETTRSMVVRAKDELRSWRVTFAPSGFQIEADPINDDAELLVTGDATELYVLLWNRREPAGSEMDGEPDLLDLWRETAQIRWS